MPEMTREQLQGAVMALTPLIADGFYSELRKFIGKSDIDGRDVYWDDMQDFVVQQYTSYRAKLAALPPQPDLRAALVEARAALDRSGDLLKATSDFVNRNPVAEYTVLYDEAECDGSCLADDCNICLGEVESAIARIDAVFSPASEAPRG